MTCPVHHSSYSGQVCLDIIYLQFFVNQNPKEFGLNDPSNLVIVNLYIHITVYSAITKDHIYNLFLIHSMTTYLH